MSENEKSISNISTNSRRVLIKLFIVIAGILSVYTISVYFYTAEEAGRLNSVFIASITGLIALGGTLITQLWGGTTSSNSDKPNFYFTSPANSEVGVPLDTRIIASSNTQIDPVSINTNTFTLKDDKNAKVEGTVTLEGGNAIFKPKEILKPNTKYTVTLTKDVKDLSGRTLSTDKVWSFTTEKQ